MLAGVHSLTSSLLVALLFLQLVQFGLALHLLPLAALLRRHPLLHDLELGLIVELALVVIFSLLGALVARVLLGHREAGLGAHTHVLGHEVLSREVVHQVLHIERLLVTVALVLSAAVGLVVDDVVQLLVHQGRDVLEVLQHIQVLALQGVVLKLLGELVVHSGAPAAHLVVDQLDILLAVL